MMRATLAHVILLLTLAACGGGGADSPAGSATPPPGDAPLIRFVLDYDADMHVTLLPISGATDISTRPVQSVDFTAIGYESQTLTSPTTNAQGQHVYAFTLPPGVPPCYDPHMCPSGVWYEARVTDTSGFSFAKWGLLSLPYRQTAGAFSDYGTRTVTFAVSDVAGGSPTVALRRANDRSLSYADMRQFATGDVTWTVAANPGDLLELWWYPYATMPEGETVSYSITAGSQVIAAGTATPASGPRNLNVTCCGP